MTADLQLGNEDKHLRLLHHVDELFEEEDDPAEEAAWIRHVELTAFGMARAERLPGNVGVLEIRPTLYHPKYAGTAVAGAMSLLWATDALLLDLRKCGRATVVGERTKGGAHPREGFTVHPHLEASVPVQRALNPVSGTNWEGVGVSPDVEVDAASAFSEGYRRALESVVALPAGVGRREVTEEARTALAGLTG